MESMRISQSCKVVCELLKCHTHVRGHEGQDMSWITLWSPELITSHLPSTGEIKICCQGREAALAESTPLCYSIWQNKQGVKKISKAGVSFCPVPEDREGESLVLLNTSPQYKAGHFWSCGQPERASALQWHLSAPMVHFRCHWLAPGMSKEAVGSDAILLMTDDRSWKNLLRTNCF